MQNYSAPKVVVTSGKSGLGDLFRAKAVSQPNDLALVDGDRQFTYADLDQRSDFLAQALLSLGIRRGERVGILAQNCSEYIELELAAAKQGFIVAALNWRLGDRELQHCINLVEPKLILLQEEFVDAVSQMNLAEIQLLEIGPDYEKHLEKARKQSEVVPRPSVDPEEGLIILYTSGTTGLPKGALVSHRAMIARALCFSSELSLALDDAFIAWAPMFHMASTDHSLATLLRGGTVYMVNGYQPEELINLVATVKIGWFVLMPGTVREFADAFAESGRSVKGIVACGAMADLVPREDIAVASAALGTPYLNSFGATETGLAPASSSTIAPGLVPKSLSKRQSSFCEVRLVDQDDVDVSPGHPGELAIRGPTLFSGYWNAQETNAKDFRNGWFHMGDMMRRNADGTLDYVDRVKYMIKSGGENIYPAEIEHVLLKDDRILEAIVVRRNDPKWGEAPVVFIVRRDQDLTVEQVKTICLADLSRYKRPREVIFIDEDDLPRSTTGKIQRHELEEMVPN